MTDSSSLYYPLVEYFLEFSVFFNNVQKIKQNINIERGSN